MTSYSGPFGTGEFGTGVYSTSPFWNGKSLIDAILKATGHKNPAQETLRRETCLDYLNNRYSMVSSSRHWTWLFSQTDFNTKAPYETGTITASKGSETLVGSGTLWSSTNILPSWKLFVTSQDNVYTVNEVNSATSLTLNSKWSGESISNSGYKAVLGLYDLPLDLENVQSLSLDGAGELIPVGTQEFFYRQSLSPQMTGRPMYYTVTARKAEDGVRTIALYPYPDQIYNLHLDYGVQVMRLEDLETSFPLIPDRQRAVLFYGALADMQIFLGDVTKSQYSERQFERMLQLMYADTQVTDSVVQIQPKRNYRNRRAMRISRVTYTRDTFGRED